MDCTKHKYYEIEIPIYDTTVWIVVDDKEPLNLFTNLDGTELYIEDIDKYTGLTYRLVRTKKKYKDGYKQGVLIYFGSDAINDMDTLTHEVFHATMDIAKHKQLVTDVELDWGLEHLAYLNGWLNSQVNKIRCGKIKPITYGKD